MFNWLFFALLFTFISCTVFQAAVIPPSSSSTVSTETTEIPPTGSSLSLAKSTTVDQTALHTTVNTTNDFFTPEAVVYSSSDVPISMYNFTRLQFYSLTAIPRMIHHWPKCYIGESQTELRNKTEVCQSGVCALLYTRTATSDNGKVSSYGCQKFQNYPAKRINMCSEDTEAYPHVRAYYDRKRMEKHVKLCCKTDHCNDPEKFQPLFPKIITVKESDELVTYDKVQCWSMVIIMVIVLIIPFYYIWEERQEAKKKKMTMDAPLEHAVVVIGNENKPEFEQKCMSEHVTGKLNLVALSRTFSMMQSFKEKRNAPQKMEDIGEDIECTVFNWNGSGNGHDLVAAVRGYTVTYDNPIWNLIEHGPYKYPWTPFELVELFDKVKGQFEIENILLHISAPLVIIGDIRGQYTDLHRWLSIVGYPPKKKLLFLGSILDESEPGSLDCFAYIMALKNSFPNSVFVLRGVGETIPMRFIHRFGAKLDSVVLTAMNRICAELPIAALISRKILAVHSGICHEIMSPRSFASLDRPINYEEIPLFARQIIFNEPTARVKTYRFDEKTRSGSYGLEAVVRVCRDMNLRMIIRSRNPLDEGILWNRSSQSNKLYDLVSIWSAPAKNSTKGAIVEFDEDGKMKVHVLERQESIIIAPCTPNPSAEVTSKTSKT